MAGGNVDYVGARTSDRLKVDVLEQVFPEAYWTGENREALENPPEFDFLDNTDKVGGIIFDYRERAEDGVHSQCWAHEFMKRYEVGKRLQGPGLHSRVSIG